MGFKSCYNVKRENLFVVKEIKQGSELIIESQTKTVKSNFFYGIFLCFLEIKFVAFKVSLLVVVDLYYALEDPSVGFLF